MSSLRLVHGHRESDDATAAVAQGPALARKIARLPRPLRLLGKQVQLLAELATDYRRGHYRQVPWRTVSMAIGAVLYFFVPLDAVPDFLPAVGLVDDAAVLAYTLKALRADLKQYCAAKGYPLADYFADG